MKKTVKKLIDISPHRSILVKISQTGYSLQEAISELIDNAIDARVPGKKLRVAVTLSPEHLIIADNGVGMTEDQAKHAIRLGFSKKVGQLGEFGLGLKTATSFLGKRFELTTKQAGSTEEYSLVYNEDQWLKNGEWTKFPFYVTAGLEPKVSGTTVTIDDLKIDLTDKLLATVQEEFGLRFGPFITNGELELTLNDEACRPYEPKLIDGKQTEFTFAFAGGKAHGWWGYQLSGLNKSYYGLHTYRRGRLVTIFDKIGLTPNQDIKQIVGELHIEGIPITHDKKGWLKSSRPYRALEAKLRDYFKPFETKPKRVLSGFPVSAGKVLGTVKIVTTTNPHIDLDKEIHKVGRGDIIVTEMTRPQFLLAIRRSAGIITNLGGNLCHAAIVSREFNIPCVVGTQTATTTLRDGQRVILDGNDGYIYED